MAESVIRFKRRQGFTIIQNQMLGDPRLSLKTKGLFAVMLSKPGNWSFSVSAMAREASVGKDAIRSSLKELREAGYLTMERQAHGEHGKFAGSVYILHEESISPLSENPATVEDDAPQSDFPSTAEPVTAEPSSDEPTLINTDLVNNDLSNPPYSPPKGTAPGRKSKYDLAEDAKPILRGYVGDDQELARCLGDLIQTRRDLRAINSARAIKTLLSELDRLSGGRREDKLLLIRQSITNSWKGIFPLKGGVRAEQAASADRPARVVKDEGVPVW